METKLPQWLIDLVRSVYVDGLNHPYKFEERFNDNELQYLVSLLLAVRKEAQIRGTTVLTESTLRGAQREKLLRKAKEFLEELETKENVKS